MKLSAEDRQELTEHLLTAMTKIVDTARAASRRRALTPSVRRAHVGADSATA